MNEAIQNMLTRRSCRSYRPDMVAPELLEQVLQAGAWAPSAMNRQPVKVVALRDPGEIRELEKMNAAVLGSPESHPFYGAPVVLVVLAENLPTAVEDGSLVMENLMLAAHSLGLGSCWINRAREEFKSPEGKALLKKWGLKEDMVGVGHCILGWPAGELPAPKARREGFAVLR